MKPRRAEKPHQVPLTLQSLGALASGQAEAVVNAALKAAIRDAEDRGDDGKVRKVTITVEFKKIGTNSVAVALLAKASLPNYQTDNTIAELTVGERGVPEAMFSFVAPDNPDQGPLPGADGE